MLGLSMNSWSYDDKTLVVRIRFSCMTLLLGIFMTGKDLKASFGALSSLKCITDLTGQREGELCVLSASVSEPCDVQE